MATLRLTGITDKIADPLSDRTPGRYCAKGEPETRNPKGRKKSESSSDPDGDSPGKKLPTELETI